MDFVRAEIGNCGEIDAMQAARLQGANAGRDATRARKGVCRANAAAWHSWVAPPGFPVFLPSERQSRPATLWFANTTAPPIQVHTLLEIHQTVAGNSEFDLRLAARPLCAPRHMR